MPTKSPTWDIKAGSTNVTDGFTLEALGQGILEASTTKMYHLGTTVNVRGRTYAYCKASESLDAGKVVTSVSDSDAEDTVTVAHGIGATELSITAASTITADQYEDGILIVDEGTGAGNTYDIVKNDAIASTAVGVVTIDFGLVVAWATADTDVVLCTSDYIVQQANTEQLELSQGAPRVAVASGSYFWSCVDGTTGVLMDEAAGAGAGTRELTLGSSTSGALEAKDLIGETTVGNVWFDGTDAEDAKYQPVRLNR